MNRAFDCDDAGLVWPVVDPDRCLGDVGCVDVCPHDVLALQPVDAACYDSLPADTRFLLSLSGGLQAFAAAPERCHACGLCLAACSQNAILLHARGGTGT